jgi:hypothetical protein
MPRNDDEAQRKHAQRLQPGTLIAPPLQPSSFPAAHRQATFCAPAQGSTMRTAQRAFPSRLSQRTKRIREAVLQAAGRDDQDGGERRGGGGEVQGVREAAVCASRPSRLATGWRQR